MDSTSMVFDNSAGEANPGLTKMSQLSSVEYIWGNMEGDIYIIYVARSQTSVIKDLMENMNKSRCNSCEKSMSQTQIAEVAKELLKFGDYFLVLGDVYAKDHILGTLRSIYDTRIIKEKNAWELGESVEDVLKNEDFKNNIRYQNIILIGGPIGNNVSDIILDECDLKWLFKEDAEDKRSILRSKNDHLPLQPKGLPPDDLTEDVGLFFQIQNPYCRSKRIYGVMGTHSWGTQAAAAVACAGESAVEVVKTPYVYDLLKKSYVENDLSVADVDKCTYATYVKTHYADNIGLSTVPDARLIYKIDWPVHDSIPWGEHKNPSDITNTLTPLRKKRSPRVLLPFRFYSMRFDF